MKTLYRISLFVFILSIVAFFGSIIDTFTIGKTEFKPTTYSFSYEDFQSKVGSKSESINAIVSNNKNGDFVYGPYFEIKKGIYNVTVFYSIPQNAKILLKSNSNNYTYGAFDMDEYFLNPNMNELTFELNVYKEVDDMEFILSNLSEIETNDELSFYGIDIVEIEKTSSLLTILSILVICIFGCLSLFFSFSKEKQKIMLSILGITILSSITVTIPYLIMGHDIIFHLLRIEGLSLELLNGNLPVKMQTHWLNGAGYPVSTFYGETLLYIPALLRLFGITVTNAYRIYIFIINLLTTISMFFVCFRLSKKNYIISVIGTMVYLLSPYRLCCLYLRASVGEFSAMIFIPLVAYAFIYLLNEETYKRRYMMQGIIPLSIGIMGLIQTHILSLEMCGLFCVLTCIVFIKRTLRIKTLLSLFFGTMVGLLSSLWFLIPFFDLSRDGRDVFVGEVASKRIQMNGLFIPQLIQLFFNGNGSSKVAIAGIYNEMPLGLGVSSITVLCLTLIFIFKSKLKHNIISFVLVLFAIISSIMTLLLFPWDSISATNEVCATIVSSIQFPWRFLTLSNIFIPLAFVSINRNITFECNDDNKDRYFHKIVLYSLVCLIIITSIQFQTNILKDNDSIYKPISTTGLPTNAGGGWEYLIKGSDVSYIESNNKPKIESGNIYDWYRKNGNTYVSCTSIEKETTLIIPVIYDKYWEVKNIDTNEIFEKKFERGLIKINIQAVDNVKIMVSYKQPLLWVYSYILNIIIVSLYVLFIVFYYYFSSESFRTIIIQKKSDIKISKHEKQKEKEKKIKKKEKQKKKKIIELETKEPNETIEYGFDCLKKETCHKKDTNQLEEPLNECVDFESIDGLIDISKY